jgi:hypothetical protein
LKPSTASRLAWALWGFTLTVIAGTITFTFLNRSHPGGDVRAVSIALLVTLAYSTVGAFIVARRQNVVGWILSALALGVSIGFLIEQYSLRGLVTAPGSLPGTAYVAALQPLFNVNFAWFGVLFLLFPDGCLPNRRWRPVLWLWLAGVVLLVLGFLMRPGPLDTPYGSGLLNPMGIRVLRWPLQAAVGLGSGFAFLSAFASVAALIVRFRRARGTQRQQIKWVAFVGATASVLLIASFVGNLDVFFISFFFTLTVGVPAALAIAIFRYRLYDIDRIINLTLVYGLVTAVLAAVYVAGVVGLGSLARTLTGQANNALVIAASTLAVAALFRPARRRIQDLIDRRFYRHKYDAAQTLEVFSSRLREQVDLEALASELVDVVRETMQPAHASLWLRSPEATSRAGKDVG